LRRKLLIYSAAVAIFFLIAAGTGVAVFYSPLLTHYIESNAFRAAMEDETAKGLHFPQCRYSPIRRTSTFTAQSESYIELFKQSPGAYLGLLFRQFEGWLKKAFSHD
jgi:hypothetical protein